MSVENNTKLQQTTAAATEEQAALTEEPVVTEASEEEPLTWLQMIGSALAAAFGVQSSANRRRDFRRGRAGPFILLGIVGTTLFVLAMWGVVQLVLSLSA